MAAEKEDRLHSKKRGFAYDQPMRSAEEDGADLFACYAARSGWMDEKPPVVQLHSHCPEWEAPKSIVSPTRPAITWRLDFRYTHAQKRRRESEAPRQLQHLRGSIFIGLN